MLVHVPCHLVIMFGAGESHEGRYRFLYKKLALLKAINILFLFNNRHVLIGRPSGGQSPCGWIPWSEQHIATGWFLTTAIEILFMRVCVLAYFSVTYYYRRNNVVGFSESL